MKSLRTANPRAPSMHGMHARAGVRASARASECRPSAACTRRSADSRATRSASRGRAVEGCAGSSGCPRNGRMCDPPLIRSGNARAAPRNERLLPPPAPTMASPPPNGGLANNPRRLPSDGSTVPAFTRPAAWTFARAMHALYRGHRRPGRRFVCAARHIAQGAAEPPTAALHMMVAPGRTRLPLQNFASSRIL